MNYFRHRPNQEDTSVWVVESDLDSHSVFHCMHPPFSVRPPLCPRRCFTKTLSVLNPIVPLLRNTFFFCR